MLKVSRNVVDVEQESSRVGRWQQNIVIVEPPATAWPWHSKIWSTPVHSIPVLQLDIWEKLLDECLD